MQDWTQSFDLTDGFNVLRILCGAFLVPHLFVKFRSQPFVLEFMSKAGLNPPKLWLYSAFAVEIVASLGLVFNVLTAYVAVLAGIFLLVAAYASYRESNGKWMWNFGGAEYPLFWAICCFVVALESAAGNAVGSV
jgi:putative oxidoreductase